MKSKVKCPHCKRKVHKLITLIERVEEEGIFNACKYCIAEDKNIIDRVNLKETYTNYNNKYFNNKLPNANLINLRWNSYLRVAAAYCIKGIDGYSIEFNPTYFNNYPDEFESIFIHEMIHLIDLSHGEKFKKEAKRLNKEFDIEICEFTKHDLRDGPKWQYKCCNCNTSIFTMKRKKNIKCSCNNILTEVLIRE